VQRDRPPGKGVVVTGRTLTIEEVVRVARFGAGASLSPKALPRIIESRRVVEEVVADEKKSYGIRTGFGQLADIKIPKRDIKRLQVNLLRSHACGAGEPLEVEEVRAMMLARANSLANGYSGVRPEVVRMLLRLIEKGVVPFVPEYGSLGASGDLIPLAHMALALIGEGTAIRGCERVRSAEALRDAGLSPLSLESKEGIALINGTSAMAGIGALLVHDALDLVRCAEVAGSISLDGLKGSDTPFQERVLKVKRGEGMLYTGYNVRVLLKGSEIRSSHLDCDRVQDAYTLRCIPQVLGAARDVIAHVRGVVEDEMNSTTDNPVIIPESKESLSGGAFHGERIAMAMDYLGLALSRVAQFSERRVARLLDERVSGLPAFLTKEQGVSSGLMLLQYLAASLASDTKVLAHPSSADSIPVSANQEDFVPMGMNSVLKSRRVLKNARYVVGIELICASQAIRFHRPMRSGKGVELALECIGKKVRPIEEDRPLSDEVEAVYRMVRDGELLAHLAKGGMRLR